MSSTPGGPGAIQGCVTDGYSAVRRNPALRNASIDRIDSCSEVTAGLFATGLVTLLIWVISMPFFDIGGLMWIRSWESAYQPEPISLEAFKADMGGEEGLARPAWISSQEWSPMGLEARKAAVVGATSEQGADRTTFDEATDNFKTPLNATQSAFAFEQLDLDRNGRVTSEELNHGLRYTRWADVQPMTSTTTTTSTAVATYTTAPEAQDATTAQAGTTVTVGNPTTGTTAEERSTTARSPAPTEAPQQPVEVDRGPGGVLPSSITGPFVEVALKVPGLGGEKLSHSARKNMANVFREDLAYAAGIMATEVMDVRGRTGCVFSAAAGTGDLDYRAKGCLALPAEATKADIAAVLGSHSMQGKIADDLTAVHMLEDRPVARTEIRLDVTETESCREEELEAGTIYCEDGQYTIGLGGAPAPAAPAAAAETTKAPEAVEHGTTEPPAAEAVTFSEFISRMNSEVHDSARDAFAEIDTDGDEIATWAQFLDAAKTKCTPPLTESQAKALFDLTDTNHNDEVDSVEFFNSFMAAHPQSGGVAPITVQEYKDSKSKAVHLLNISLIISNNDQISVTEDSAWRVVDSLVDDIAFEAGVPTMACHDLDWTPAALALYINGQKINKKDGADAGGPMPARANAAPLEAYMMIEIPEGRHDDDVVAVLNTDDTKQRLANHLSSLPNFGQIAAADILMHFDRVAGEFHFLDEDKSGGLSLEEFRKAAAKFDPPLTDAQAEYAFQHLNQDDHPDLNKDEFDAAHITEFSAQLETSSMQHN